MALKDRLTEALNATPPENSRRAATLREVLAAADARVGATDADILGIVSRIIMEREQRAASFSAAGQSDFAKAEREEIDFLRGFLRVPAAAPAPKNPAPAAPAGVFEKPAAMVSRTQIIIAGVAGALLVVAALVYIFVISPGSGNNMLLVNSANAAVTVMKTDHVLGSPKAPITVIEYAAPSCPHCAHFFATVFPLIKTNYIDTGKIFYIFRVFPINASDGAAEAIARCLPADNYFSFIDLLFRNQKVWDPEYGITDVRSGLIQMARIAGMSAQKVDQCISDKDVQDSINAVAQDGDTKYSISGVPTFVINGTVVQATEATWPLMQARFDTLLSKH